MSGPLWLSCKQKVCALLCQGHQDPKGLGEWELVRAAASPWCPAEAQEWSKT